MPSDVYPDASQNPLISIIIPHYRDVHFDVNFFRECLHSVQTQTFAGYECIVVLDGADTECEDVFLELVGCDSRFFLVKQPHSGLAAARICGIKKTSGKWVLSLDSDDYFMNNNSLQIIYDQLPQAQNSSLNQPSKNTILANIKAIPVYERPNVASAESWLVYLQYSITQCVIPRMWLLSYPYPLSTSFDFDVAATLAPILTHDCTIKQLQTPEVFYRQRIGSLNYIKENHFPETETKQAIGTYHFFLSLKNITLRQKLLCYLGILRYQLTPPKNLFKRLFRAKLTVISKLLSATTWHKNLTK